MNTLFKNPRVKLSREGYCLLHRQVLSATLGDAGMRRHSTLAGTPSESSAASRVTATNKTGSASAPNAMPTCTIGELWRWSACLADR